MSKCPKCGNGISNVKAEEIKITGATHSFPGVAYVCPSPSCSAIISVSIDPMVQENSLMERIEEMLKNR